MAKIWALLDSPSEARNCNVDEAVLRLPNVRFSRRSSILSNLAGSDLSVASHFGAGSEPVILRS